MAEQDLSGPLSSQVKVTVLNTDAVIANLYARNEQVQKIVSAMVRAYGHEALAVTREETPVDEGNMQELADVRFTPKMRGFEVGWNRQDFFDRGLRWYVPYVLEGTRRTPANPVLRRMERRVMPRFRAALGAEIRRATGDV
jgi:hypothetical protein